VTAQAVHAINDGDIPSPSGIIESFNANLLQTSIKVPSPLPPVIPSELPSPPLNNQLPPTSSPIVTQAFREALDSVILPVPEPILLAARAKGIVLATERLRQQSFGDAVSEEDLRVRLAKEYREVAERNLMRSQQLCERLEMACSDGLEVVSQRPSRHALMCFHFSPHILPATAVA